MTSPSGGPILTSPSGGANLASPSGGIKSPSFNRRRSVVGLMASMGGETDFDFSAKSPPTSVANTEKKRRSSIVTFESPSGSSSCLNPKSPGMFPTSPLPVVVPSMDKYRLDSEKASSSMANHLSGINLIDINSIRNTPKSSPMISPTLLSPAISGKLVSPTSNFKRSATLAPKLTGSTPQAFVFQRPSIVETEEDEEEEEKESAEELKIINSALKRFQNGDDSIVDEADAVSAVTYDDDDEDGMIPDRLLPSYKNNLLNNYTNSYFGSGKLDNMQNYSSNQSNSLSVDTNQSRNSSISNFQKPLTSPTNKTLSKKESDALNKLHNSLNKIIEDTANDVEEGLSFKDSISLITPKPMSSDKVRKNYSFSNHK